MQANGVATQPVALRLDSALIENWLTGAGVSIVTTATAHQRADAGDMEGPKATQLFEWIQTMTSDGLLELLPPTADGSDPAPATTLQTAAMTIALHRHQRLRPDRWERHPTSTWLRSRASTAPATARWAASPGT
jgi:hypothetical protein